MLVSKAFKIAFFFFISLLHTLIGQEVTGVNQCKYNPIKATFVPLLSKRASQYYFYLMWHLWHSFGYSTRGTSWPASVAKHQLKKGKDRVADFALDQRQLNILPLPRHSIYQQALFFSTAFLSGSQAISTLIHQATTNIKPKDLFSLRHKTLKITSYLFGRL